MTTTAENHCRCCDPLRPSDQTELAAIVRQSFADRVAVYAIGGGTSLACGLPARTSGVGLSLEKLNRVVDYPSRDMTITVEAGIRMADLQRTLATENQWLPVDTPQASQATLGGIVATNTSGPRRFGQGTIRDYVIGISAVDGRGGPFKAGGRVVKNVAGYDFCKLLVGSYGTLAVITQLTLKAKPRPEASALVACDVRDYSQADALFATLVTSQTTPVTVDLLTGPAWQTDEALGSLPAGSVARLVVGFEGSRPEVDWMVGQLAAEWRIPGRGRSSHHRRRTNGGSLAAAHRFSDRGRSAAGAEDRRAAERRLPYYATSHPNRSRLFDAGPCRQRHRAGPAKPFTGRRISGLDRPPATGGRPRGRTHHHLVDAHA